jgi:hypothetical protein
VACSFHIRQVWFSREVMTRMSCLIIAQLLRQFFTLGDFKRRGTEMMGIRQKEKGPKIFCLLPLMLSGQLEGKTQPQANRPAVINPLLSVTNVVPSKVGIWRDVYNSERAIRIYADTEIAKQCEAGIQR